MRMMTLNSQSQRINTVKNVTISNAFNTKISFPNIFHSPNRPKITKYKNKNLFILKKDNRKHPEIHSPLIYRNRGIQNLNMVKILTFEDTINDIINTDLLLEKQKEKIDNNKTIKLLRLGLYKKKEKNENDDDNNNINDNNKDKENLFNNILEKEKENEEDLEKMENENREKEMKLEKKYKDKLLDLENIKNECNNINQKIININDKIEDNQLETNILSNYADEFDKKYEKQISQNINDKNNNKNNEENLVVKKSNEISEANKKKEKQFEKLNKLIIYKQQREDKKKYLKERIFEQEKIKEELEKELINKKNLYNKYKKEVDIIKKQLINSYHLKLYEGLIAHNEGLSSIIKDIWNLGVNVNVSFMPTFLDDLSIEFLFQRAKYSIEVAKIRQVITINEKELALFLKEWKLNNIEINNTLNKKSGKGFYDKNDEHKNTINSLNEKELFKTKISDMSISYLDPYPKTKEFIIEYKKKHPQLFHRDMPEVDVKHLKFKSLNIPSKILEKNKTIEKMKYLLGLKIDQNKQKDKNEVQRLNKEFIKNNYQERYKINVENLFGALFGDKKNEMLIYYSKLEKEFRDGKKTIQFHTKNHKIK